MPATDLAICGSGPDMSFVNRLLRKCGHSGNICGKPVPQSSARDSTRLAETSTLPQLAKDLKLLKTYTSLDGSTLLDARSGAFFAPSRCPPFSVEMVSHGS